MGQRQIWVDDAGGAAARPVPPATPGSGDGAEIEVVIRAFAAAARALARGSDGFLAAGAPGAEGAVQVCAVREGAAGRVRERLVARAVCRAGHGPPSGAVVLTREAIEHNIVFPVVPVITLPRRLIDSGESITDEPAGPHGAPGSRSI